MVACAPRVAPGVVSARWSRVGDGTIFQMGWGHRSSPHGCVGDLMFKSENGISHREVEFQVSVNVCVLYTCCPWHDSVFRKSDITSGLTGANCNYISSSGVSNVPKKTIYF